MAGEISRDEYNAFWDEYNYAQVHRGPLNRVKNQAAYIRQLAEEGREAWFVYDTGWNRLFFSTFDWTLYAAILLLFCSSFTVEKESKSSAGGFAQILRTTRRGRGRTWAAKYLSAVSLSALLALIWNLIDLIRVNSVWALHLAGAPLWSLTSFTDFAPDMTLLGYLLLFFAVRMLAAVLLAALVCSASALLRRPISILCAVVFLTLLPSLLGHFGVEALVTYHFTALMQATPILLLNTAGLIFGAFVLIACSAAACCAGKVWNT